MENSDVKFLLSRVRALMLEIRKATPRRAFPDWRSPADLVLRDDYLKGARVRAASLTLFPTGCQFALRGGCTMCGEWAGSNLGDLVPAEFHIAQFASACAGLFSRETIEWLRVYQEGSFLNPAEVAPDARDVILRLASSFKGVSRITIESRPEYLTNMLASKIRNQTRDVELEIGIGMESKDDFVRNVCIGKGTYLGLYERAAKIAKSQDIIALAYVLLKPPFLSEYEAIEDAVKTVQFAFQIGFNEVYVQISSIHEWSLSELLVSHDYYSLPWLWSIVEVIKRTARMGDVKIGGLEYFPRPSVVALNYQDAQKKIPCLCSDNVWISIQEFNATGDIGVFNNLSCSCQDVWRSEISTSVPDLLQRISQILPQLSVQDYVSRKLIERQK